MAATKTEKAAQYEAMFLLGPTATADPEGAMTLCRGMIERHHGKVLFIKKWDERKLQYEIKGQKRGLYIIAYFTAPAANITPLERDVTLSEDVLRVLITDAAHMNKEEMEAVEPQPIQPREERPSWDRPSFGSDRPDRGGDRGPRREAAPAEAAKD